MARARSWPLSMPTRAPASSSTTRWRTFSASRRSAASFSVARVLMPSTGWLITWASGRPPAAASMARQRAASRAVSTPTGRPSASTTTTLAPAPRPMARAASCSVCSTGTTRATGCITDGTRCWPASTLRCISMRKSVSLTRPTRRCCASTTPRCDTPRCRHSCQAWSQGRLPSTVSSGSAASSAGVSRGRSPRSTASRRISLTMPWARPSASTTGTHDTRRAAISRATSASWAPGPTCTTGREAMLSSRRCNGWAGAVSAMAGWGQRRRRSATAAKSASQPPRAWHTTGSNCCPARAWM